MAAPTTRATKAAPVAPSAPVSAIISNPVKTRDDAFDLLASLLAPLAEAQSEGGARVRLQAGGAIFDSIAADFEGYARALWGLAPALAGEPNHPVLRPLGDKWARGLDAGTDPEHPEFWGCPTTYDQRFVEMAAVGVAIGLVPDVFWHPQSAEAKKRIAKWLLAINENDIAQNNWRFFRILVNVGLKRVGAEYSEDIIDETFKYIQTFYDSEDIPSDGVCGDILAYDYYATSFAIPFYELMYTRLNPDDTSRAKKAFERARANAPRAVHLFAQDGSAIAFGRSMTYRFACVGFFSAMAWAFDEPPAPFSWGVLKGLVLRNIRWFTQRESVFNRDGSLTIGWAYPQLYMSEQYNSPESPYWALKSLLVLSLPKDHPFWTAKEEPIPAEFATGTVVKSWSQVFSHEAGHDFLLTQGQRTNWPMRQTASKYGKMAYSAQFGFSVSTGQYGLVTAGADSTLAVSEGPESWKVPRVVEDATVSDAGVVTSKWLPWSDVTVRNWLFPPSKGKPYHIRVHHITSGRDITFSAAGFSINSQSGPEGNERAIPVLASAAEVATTHGRWCNGDAALAASASGVTGVMGLLPGKQESQVVMSDPSANLVFPRSVFPASIGKICAGEETWLAVCIFATPSLSGAEWLQEWNQLKPWASVEAMKQELEIS